MDNNRGLPGKPQLLRPQEGRWIAGVSAGLSRRLRLPVWMVRSLFILLAFPFHLLPIQLYELFDHWLALPIWIVIAPFGYHDYYFSVPYFYLVPVGWGVVLYLTGWMIIPRREDGYPGNQERKTRLTYPKRALVYLAVPLIAPLISYEYVSGIDHMINTDWEMRWVLLTFGSIVFWPSMLLLSAARFHIRGTLICSTVCFGLLVMLWVWIHPGESGSLSMLILASYNTVAVPIILLVIGLSELYRRRTGKDQPIPRQLARQRNLKS